MTIQLVEPEVADIETLFIVTGEQFAYTSSSLIRQIAALGGSLDRLRDIATRAWFTWLRRRSQRRTLAWSRFKLMLKHYPLPRPRIYHSVYRPGANP